MNENAPEGAPSPEILRAEELVDSWGRSLGALARAVSHEVVKSVALAREEIEDIWAEAQSLKADQGK